MDNEEDLIPFIHNYCDRWCERCDMTSRCRVFAMEAELSDEEKDPDGAAFSRTLSNILGDAKKMLEEKALEFGIEFDEEPDPEVIQSIDRKRASVRSEEITKLAEQYASDTRTVLDAKDDWLAEGSADDPLTEEMLEILYWYLFFIAVKAQRGLGGIVDFDGDEDWEQLNDPQSDANGSIKVALIAIERSILAWTYLLAPENREVIRPEIELLETIRSRTEAKFPLAREFVRPGFDELDIVM